MKAVWIEGACEELRAVLEALPHPYKLFSLEEGCALLVEGVEEATLARLTKAGGRPLRLEEEGCGKRSGSSP